MNSSSLSPIQWRLAQLGAHIVVALVALVVVGGSTRVMEAGLACPDWPLCFGSLLPGQQMNMQVFLEWFHRLDAFLVGIAFIVQLVLGLIWRPKLPLWLLLAYSLLLLLVALQAFLGALTVQNLLPPRVVSAHFALALILVACMSGLTQRLLSRSDLPSPLWWRFMTGGSLIAVFGQCLLGSQLGTTWAAHRCLAQGEDCQWLSLHRGSAWPVAAFLMIYVVTSLLIGGWARSQWPFLLAVFVLVVMQISLGLLTVQFGLNQPLLTVGHQLVAVLMVAFLAALICRRPPKEEPTLSESTHESFLEPCHG